MQLNKSETMHKICPLCSPYSLLGSFQVNWLRCVRDALILFTTNFRDVERKANRNEEVFSLHAHIAQSNKRKFRISRQVNMRRYDITYLIC
jgi:hypothetical protein